MDDLSIFNVEIGEISIARRVRAYPAIACCDARHRNMVDVQVPFRVAANAIRSNLIDLKALLNDCSELRKQGQAGNVRTHGQFKILHVKGESPSDQLHAGTIAQLFLKIDQHIRAVSFGIGEPVQSNSEPDITDEPTLDIAVVSWRCFSINARVPGGRIEVQIDYPDDLNLQNGKRPIDEIDSFLTAALAWCQAAQPSIPSNLQERIAAYQAASPSAEVPEHMRSSFFVGQLNYQPVGGQYGFDQSYLKLVADTTHIPQHNNVGRVLVKFRQQLVEAVPELCG